MIERRERTPENRPVIKVNTLESLNGAMEGRVHSAAYVENPLPADSQSLIKKFVTDKKLREQLYLGFEDKKREKAKEQTLNERFDELVLYVRKSYGEGTKKCLDAEEFLRILKHDIVAICVAFPKYTLRSFSVRYDNPTLFSGVTDPLKVFHQDGGYIPDHLGGDYEEPTEKSLRIVRTYVGSSTEFVSDNDLKRGDVVTPADGSTTVHAIPSLVWHRQPAARRNKMRFAIALEFDPI
jgi:hypothetical protein